MTPETLLRQFDVVADAANGVQKLRELTLQLAVQGMLVPQNHSDEPASALLERIAIEKEGLFDERELARSKWPPTGEDDPPYTAPHGWEWTQLDRLGIVSPRNDVSDDAKVAFCPMASLPEVYGGSVAYEARSWHEIKKGYTHFAENDVVVAKITPCFQNGKAAVMRHVLGGVGAGTTELHVFRPIEDTVDPDYVLIFLKSPRFVRRGVQTMTGTAGQQRVSKGYFAHSPFPLPPRTEQRRIVAKVKELMALCDHLEERQRRRTMERARLNQSVLSHLTTASDDASLAAHWKRLRENFQLVYDTPETIADLREAVVQLAVRGKLLSQDPSDEPVPTLLERIAAEKQQLIEGAAIGMAKRLPPVREDEVPHELPLGWQWVRFGEVTAWIEAGWSPNCNPEPRRPGEWGVLKISAVSWGVFDPDENKALPAHLEPRPEYEVQVGDFLMSRANTAQLVGRSVVVIQTPPRLLLNDKTLRVRFPQSTDRHYMNLFNTSRVARRYYAEQASGTSSSMRNLSRGQIQLLPVPLPPLAEQRRIVAKVRELVLLADALEAHLTCAREKSAHLAASVVDHVGNA